MRILGIDPTRVTTDEEFELNTLAFTSGDGKGWVYIKASAAIAAKAACDIQNSGAAQGLTTTRLGKGQRIGIAPVAIASGSHGWLQVYGNAVGICNAAIAADAQVRTHGDAGEIDDATGSSAEPIGGIFVETATTAAGDINLFLNFPFGT